MGVAVLVALCLLIVSVEALLRLRRAASDESDPFWQASAIIHRKARDPRLVYELVPGATTTREGVAVQINSAGFRDDEFPPAGDGRRIVLLGDSVAWGWGVPMERAFPQLLEERINVGGSRRTFVLNLAVDGYSTDQELRLLEVRGLELGPDLVVLSYVLNDPDTQDGGLGRYFRPPSEILQRVFKLQRRLKRLTRAPGSPRPPRDYHQRIHETHRSAIREHFARLGEISASREVPILVAAVPVFMFEPGESYAWANLHQRIRALCAENGLAFLDLYDVFRSTSSLDVAFDIWHPNELGHSMIADALTNHLTESWQWPDPRRERPVARD